MSEFTPVPSPIHEVRTITPAFTDARGSIFDVLEEPIGHVGMVTFVKGAVRANHYHLTSTQYSYILSGEIRVTVSQIDGSGKEEMVLTPGMLSIVPPMVVHTYECLSDEASMLDMTTLNRKDDGYEKDTVRMSA